MTETTPKYLAIRNFRRYQHYKNRAPVWVKLYVDTLKDDQFNDLATSTKLLAILLLLVAANRDNRIPNDPAWIATECGITAREVRTALAELLAVAYLIPASTTASKNASQPASNGASDPATTRARVREETEKEREKERTSSVVESVKRPAADDDAKNDNEEPGEPVDLAALGFDPDDIFGEL